MISGICVNCSAISHSTGPINSSTLCGCTAPYIWSWDPVLGGACSCSGLQEITVTQTPGCFDCATVTYGAGTKGVGVCICNPNFVWNATSLTCYCPATWFFNVTDNSCSCSDAVNAVIDNICVNCSTIAHNDGPNTNHTLCTCLIPDNWAWIAETGYCNCNSTY
jgi:hypothetical protein